MKKEIPVFFTADNGYAPFLAIAVHSLAENAASDYAHRVIILHEKISCENQVKIASLANDRVSIEFEEMEQGIITINDKMSNRLRCDYFTITIFFRLLIPAMFPQYDKGIYIDSDVVLAGDIAKLFETDIGDNLIGACRDFSVQKVPELCDYMDKGVGVGKDK